MESPNEKEVDTQRPTIIQQEDNLEIFINEISQALAESLKCSIRNSCQVLLVDDPVYQKYHIESVALDGGSHKNCTWMYEGFFSPPKNPLYIASDKTPRTWDNLSYSNSWCFESSLNQCKSNCRIENSNPAFKLQNIFLLKFTKNHEFLGLNELSIPISCKVNRCQPLAKRSFGRRF